MAIGEILIVEDERIIAADLKHDLESFGYTVCGVASCGRDAIQLAEDTSPDLVLMDINLKGNLDGVQVAKELKNRFNIPVVYLTGHADETTLIRVKETDPAGFIVKPFRQKEIRAAVEVGLSRRRGPSLRTRETWFSCVLQGMPDAVVATNREGVIRFINLAAEMLLGWEAGEAIGKPIQTILTFTDDSLAIPNETEWLSSGKFGWIREATILSKDMIETPVEFTIGPITELGGDECGAVFVLRDLARRTFT
jgi:PAS domain S-box-containing protein